jgi:hypothetical protein
MREDEPVISVDTKKKENIGSFRNDGAEYHKQGNPSKVLDHDFPIKELGRVNPYGVYDISKNTGFINLGISHDTSEFAIESIYRWWESIGSKKYPYATKLFITCDRGGSNSSRVKLWKVELQKLATKTGLDISVSHFPPGTSKWNKIERRLFCFISKNWRGVPLVSVEAVIDLIASTKTGKGLTEKCMLDEHVYEKGKIVSKELFESVNITEDKFHGNWNYTVKK